MDLHRESVTLRAHCPVRQCGRLPLGQMSSKGYVYILIDCYLCQQVSSTRDSV